jgi:gluconolactonase
MTMTEQTTASQATGSAGRNRWTSSEPIRYPDPDIIVLDPRFERMILGHAAIERIATGCRFTEGPVWFGDLRQLVFSDIPNDRLVRWDEETGAENRCAAQARRLSRRQYP